MADRPPPGVLLTNIGSPDAPTAKALRTFLREFLSDRRVVEAPRVVWWLVLNLFILPFRPRRSARLYANIWSEHGSPLMATSCHQATGLAQALTARAGRTIPVALGMRYGSPSIEHGLDRLHEMGCDRVLILPLFPQYSASTTAASFDGVADVMRRRRSLPDMRFVRDYHDDPGYIAALASSIREAWATERPAELLLMSFHGIPKRYADRGDPYPEQCATTAALLAKALGVEKDRWRMTFQSRFGPEEWLTPYTDETLKALGRNGVGIDTVCPGFAADCLETLEEMAITNRELYEKAGGRRFRYIGALDDRPDHISALAEIAAAAMVGWL